MPDLDDAVSNRRSALKHMLAASWMFVPFALHISKRSIREPALASPASFSHSPSERMLGLTALSNRAHFVALPASKEQLMQCFSNTLQCGAPMIFTARGITEPILAFRFPGGGSISIEFSDRALIERDARRGAWLEIQTDDLEGLTKRILESGLEKVEYAATTTFYFAAPGGQVFGVVSRQGQQAEIRNP